VDALREAGVDVVRIEKRGAIDPRFVWKLIRFLRGGGFDIAHCFSITAEVWVRFALLWSKGTRLISSVRGLGGEGPRWQWRAKRWVIQGSAAVISNSRAGVELVSQRCGLGTERFRVVNNGVRVPAVVEPPHERRAARLRLGLDADRPLLLFVGRLVAEKNVGLLLRALTRIAAAERPQVCLAGEGPDRVALQRQTDASDLQSDVRFLGERSDTAQLMQTADLLVLPSREEGLSNVILEAMGSSLAVVATDVGGSPELIEHGQTGLLVASDDETALADAIQTLLQHEAKRQALGDNARRAAQSNYSIEAMVERTLHIYDRCTAQTGTA
jgi:glycosyltransferase involved in cell wall biosynthesis